jgi:hypothetical protein
MGPAELRAPARTRKPTSSALCPSTRANELWAAERRGAVELLASLANWDAALLRRAALEVASEWTNRGARDLLLEAAQIRG